MPPVTPPQPGSNRPRSARGHGVELRDDLLHAAMGLLSVAGDPEDVSIRAVAKAAGVSPTAAYRHFTDRDALIEAACNHCFGDFAAHVQDAAADATDPFDALERAARAYVAYAEQDQGIYRVLFSNPLHLDRNWSDLGSPGRTAFNLLIEMIEACLEAGAPATGPGGELPADAAYLAFQAWTWLHGLVDLRITHANMPWPDMVLMLGDLARTLGLSRPT